jgi:hypothetical protein
MAYQLVEDDLTVAEIERLDKTPCAGETSPTRAALASAP